uniref:Uncharacterized protein n=1 Tax=Romanomermis culicivorax TaxID=13658 RepID=A0A915K3S8_ROMCU
MHITNYAINKHKIDNSCNSSNLLHGAKRSIDHVLHDLEAAGIVADVKKLWRQIRGLATRTVISILPDLMIYHAKQLNGQEKKCFQILGFDILLTSDCKPLLLEINYSPNLSINLNSEQTDDNKLDFEIKTPVIRDTLLLMTGRIWAGDEHCFWTPNCHLTYFIDGLDLSRYFDDSEMISFEGFFEILLYIATNKYPASKAEKPGDQLRKLLCYCRMRNLTANVASASGLNATFSIPRWKTMHDLPSAARSRQKFWFSAQQPAVRHRLGSSAAIPGAIAVVL